MPAPGLQHLENTRSNSRLIPATSVNIANAAVFNLKKDLHLTTGQRYNNCLVIFFIPYILFEIPSNLLLKRFKPNVWLSGCMFLFGLVSICQGLVQGYSGLLATRFFLGLAESGMLRSESSGERGVCADRKWQACSQDAST